MPPRRLLVLPFLLSLLLADSWCSPAFCQDPPEFAVGTTPSATYHGGDFDFVDVATGRLNLHIPLVIDKSQRGKLNFTYSISYTSTGAWQNTIVNRSNNSYFYIEPPTYGVGAPVFIMDGALGAAQGQTYKDYLNHYNFSYWVPEGGYAYGAGPRHQLSTTAVSETIDGSGIKDITAFGNGATNKDGISFTLNSTGAYTIADTNGNELSQALSGNTTTTTDTLGRSWTTTTFGSNLTGCPAGTATPYTSTIWTIPAPNGGTRTFKLCYSAINVQTNFNDGYTNYTNSVSAMTGIVLPDGTTWTFEYANNSYGDLAKVILPTGGYISYTWTTNNGGCFTSDAGTRAVQSRTTYDGSNSYSWNYAYSTGTTTVTDPLGNDTVHSGYNCGQSPVTEIQYYSGSSKSGGTLLKTVQKTFKYLTNPFPCDVTEWCGYLGPSLPLSTTTIWANGQQSEAQLTYDSGFNFTDGNPDYGGTNPISTVYGLVTAESHSDYGNGSPGPIISTTNTTYLPLSNAPNAAAYLASNILDFPYKVVVTDGSLPTPNVCSETDYGYDEYALDPSTVSKQHVAAPNPVIGNQTSVTRQYFSNPCTSPTPSESPYKTVTHYFDTGMKHTVTDPNQNPTAYAYSPTFYGAYVTQTTFPPTSSPNPANHIISGNYDFDSGLLTCFTDQNSNTSSYTYDVLLRLTSVSYAPASSPCSGQANGQTLFNYPNTTTVEMKKQIDATRWTDSFVYYDGLGRESRRMSVNDESLPYDQVDTCYDADGRVGFKTYPYQAQGTSTAKACTNTAEPGDTFAYDPLNRVTQVTHSDNSTVLTSYAGRATSVQDEGNGTTRVQRISQVDGMDRLASVCEVSGTTVLGSGATPAACNLDIGGTGFLTTYSYDPLGDLIGVSQGGYLPRSFTYDSLARLVTSSNPEAGTISYSYLNGGQPCSGDLSLPCQRTSPKPTQTSSSVTMTATMAYDQLNRLRTKNYSNSDSSTTYLAPSVTFNYDESSALGVSLANTDGHVNTDGRISSSVVAGSQGGEVFAYDALGHVINNSQCTPQNCGSNGIFSIGYTYDLLGDTLTATNGVGVVTLTNSFNRAQRLTGTTSSYANSAVPGTLYSGAHYNAAGSIAAASMGNSGSSVNESRTYDGRLRLASITDGSVYNVSIPSAGGYAPDGDILQAVDSSNGTWSYSYDEMNRLCDTNHSSTAPACHGSATITYGYDRFGNMWQGDGGLSISFTGNNNRIDGLASHYDAAGNLLFDGATNYTYDSESRIISATNGSGTSSYEYDADGRRIRKMTPSLGTVDFLYDLAGHEITEVSSTGAWIRGEVYAGGRHLATYTNSTAYFSFSDWLGTERARSTPGATSACETITSLPFGDGLTTSGSCGDPSPMHFTGKEHDNETGLDNFGARYDSSQYGRFMTADWDTKPIDVPYADFSNPQSLNLYTYVKNNPTTMRDPDGHCCDFNDVVNFVGGFTNAFGSDNLAGAGRREQNTTAGQMGQATGDFVAGVQGGLETLAGTGGELVGTALDATGVGAPAGVPVNIASAGLIAHGITTGAEGGGHLIESVAQKSGKAGEVYVTGPQESGKPYVGRTTQGTDKRMKTRTDGRTGNAEVVDTYKTTEEGQYKEQKQMDKQGGVSNLDNQRREVNPERMKTLENKYGN